MSPLINVPEQELRVEYIPLPSGRYQADFVSAEVVGNDNGWRAIAPTFNNLSLPTGETSLRVTHKGREVTLDLATRQKRARFTVESDNAQAMQIGAGDIARLGQALGVASLVDGHVTVPGETPEEIVEALNAAAGTRVNLSIKTGPRMRNKVVQTNEAGEPIIDDEIRRVFRIE